MHKFVGNACTIRKGLTSRTYIEICINEKQFIKHGQKTNPDFTEEDPYIPLVTREMQMKPTMNYLYTVHTTGKY